MSKIFADLLKRVCTNRKEDTNQIMNGVYYVMGKLGGLDQSFVKSPEEIDGRKEIDKQLRRLLEVVSATLEDLSKEPGELDHAELLNVHPPIVMAKISELTKLQSSIGLQLKLTGESCQLRTERKYYPEAIMKFRELPISDPKLLFGLLLPPGTFPYLQLTFQHAFRTEPSLS